MRRTAVLGLVLAGCIEVTRFPCSEDAECDLDGREGFCEPDAVCSYPDDACLTGRRYEPNAEAEGDGCVPLRTDCEIYCDIFARKCDESPYTYTSRDACLGYCAQFPEGSIEDATGDSLGCRINQLRNVDDWSTDRNCERAYRSGGSTCRDPMAPGCDLYCDAWVGACSMLPDPPPVDVAACTIACSTLYPGYLGDDLDSVGCRLQRIIDLMNQLSMTPEEQVPVVLGLGCAESNPTDDNTYCALPS